MVGGRRDMAQQPPPESTNGGEFLLSLLQRPNYQTHHTQQQHSLPSGPSLSPLTPQQQSIMFDPAVASFGPSSPFSAQTPSNNRDFQPPGWQPQQNFTSSSNQDYAGFHQSPWRGSQQFNESQQFDEFRRVGLSGNTNILHDSRQHQGTPWNEQKIMFGSVSSSNMNELSGNLTQTPKSRSFDSPSNRQFNSQTSYGSNPNRNTIEKSNLDVPYDRRGSGSMNQNRGGNYRSTHPPGFTSNSRDGVYRESMHSVSKEKRDYESRRMSASPNPNDPKIYNNEVHTVGIALCEIDHPRETMHSVSRSKEKLEYESRRMRPPNPNDLKIYNNEFHTVGIAICEIDHPSPAVEEVHRVGTVNVIDHPSPAVEEVHRVGTVNVIDHPSSSAGSSLRSFSDKSLQDSHNRLVEAGVDLDDLSERLVDSLLIEEDVSSDQNEEKKHRREKDFRSDTRGQYILSQRTRISRRGMICRRDIDRLNGHFFSIYKSLVPAEEVKAKQSQLLRLLEKLVTKEWPQARLYIYGSCANSFDILKSDIDICLAIDGKDINKSDIILKLADMSRLDNLQNVQALTRARVPILKLKDPVTGISCDICVNNQLAVVNSKLLRDYAQIDVRLRQLALIVKHWAKSRGVNEAYQGTLSSYAYVLMSINFLQQRRPPILPCLQEMRPTYSVIVDDIECAFFDQVEKLNGFGSHNNESIAHLVWAFFNYWAYFHDFTNSVISIRRGRVISKRDKDWTRRIGNDRHLICIEDPFEVSHDLGRVVDRNSIRVLREEFERAAEIMQHDPNPCVRLFEPYVPC